MNHASEYLYFQNENGDIESRQEDHKKYDDKGNKVEESEYGSGGELIRRETNKYDEKGNMVEANYYNLEGSLNDKSTYKYEFDNHGNWLKRIESQGMIYRREYKYYD